MTLIFFTQFQKICPVSHSPGFPGGDRIGKEARPLRSIRTKFLALTVLSVIVSILAIGLTCIISIKVEEDNNARQQMILLCETKQQEVDAYLNSIEQSVATVSRLATDDLNGGDVDLDSHLALVERSFASIAGNTNGAMSYYYRIAPEISDTKQGFLYIRSGASGFTQEPLTDLSAYDADDVSRVGWYTIPKARGVSSWLEPYFNENLGVRMISYVAPIYRHGVFFGVIGMDFKYSTLVDQIRSIEIFDTGYAFLSDAEERIVYHPTQSRGTYIPSVIPELTRDRRGHQAPIVSYSYQGVRKRAASAELSNGMFLYITAPEAEINAGWMRLVSIIIEVTAGLLIACGVVTALIVGRITGPLRRLTEAALEVDAGNYDVELDYQGSDEVGILTGAFRQLTRHLKVYISDLNSRAYNDSLTSVRNKGAYGIYATKLQDRIDAPGEEPPEFAICMFDCNDLKGINDLYGHDKGDLYLKNACMLICKTFQHSPVFRMGGDEFAACLQRDDYRNREDLLRWFEARIEEIDAQAKEPWERVDIAKGVAVFDPARDKTVDDVLRRADEEMYRHKRSMKAEKETVRETSPV